MEKAFTITFHWATNYGAVLQAYALQTYLIECGFDATLIDYVPKGHEKRFFRALIGRNPGKIRKQLREYTKEKKIREFRKRYLRLTKRFASQAELEAHNWPNGIYICGSDQIWNPYFTLHGEGTITTPYYLSFVADFPKIAYAASFGVTELSAEMRNVIVPLLTDFKSVSTRERTAGFMLNDIGITSSLVCDPVFLISREYYKKIAAESNIPKGCLLPYILHEGQKEAWKCVEYALEKYGIEAYTNVDVMSVSEWLNAISSARIVVTNSFHAIAFSIIFHVPFIAVLIKGSGMNDRLLTLLESVGLHHRAIEEYDQKIIDQLLDEPIDWESMDEKVEKMRENAERFLQQG